MSYAPPPGGPTGSWGPTDPYGTMGASPQGETPLGAPKPGSAQAQPPSQAPVPQGLPGQSAGGGAPWAGAPSGSAGPQVPPPPGGFAPTGYGAAGPVQGGYQMRPPAPLASGSGSNKGMWIAIAAVVGVLVIALGGLGIYKLATSGAAPSANAGTTVLGTASMAGGSVKSEFSILPGPNDANGKRTIIVMQKVTNDSSQTIKVDEYSMFVMQNGELLEFSDYPSGKEPDQVDPGKWWEAVRPGQETTVAFAYTLVDSSQVEIEPYEQNDLSIDYAKYYWQPN